MHPFGENESRNGSFFVPLYYTIQLDRICDLFSFEKYIRIILASTSHFDCGFILVFLIVHLYKSKHLFQEVIGKWVSIQFVYFRCV